MKVLISSLLGGAVLLAGPVLAHAQNAPQWVAVPPGFAVVAVPGGGPTSLPVIASPAAMIQQMDALMAQAEQAEAVMQAAFAAIPDTAPSAGVVITTISDGAHSCTRRITYPGNGGKPVMELTSTANGCAMEGIGQPAPAAPTTPVLLPTVKTAPAAPGLIEAKNASGDLKLADRD